MNRFLLMLSLFLAAASGCTQQAPAPPPIAADPAASASRVILADGTPINVEIAADDDTRAQGLMYRDRVREGWGMLFFFPADAELSFWMKNTLIPLDLIWIGQDRVVKAVRSDIPPCKADPCPSYGPGVMSRYVLEVGAGVARKHNIKPGDKLRFESLDNVVIR